MQESQPGDQEARGNDVAVEPVEHDGIERGLGANKDSNDNYVCSDDEEELNFHGWDTEGIECFEGWNPRPNPSAQGPDIETPSGQVVTDRQSKLGRADQKQRVNETKKLKQHKNPDKSLKSKDKRTGKKLSETSGTDDKVQMHYCDVCEYSSVRKWNVKTHRYTSYYTV